MEIFTNTWQMYDYLFGKVKYIRFCVCTFVYEVHIDWDYITKWYGTDQAF